MRRPGQPDGDRGDGLSDTNSLSGVVTIAAGGELYNDGTLTLLATASLTNNGYLENDGTLASSGGFANAGTFEDYGSLTNTGTMTNNATGTFDVAAGATFNDGSCAVAYLLNYGAMSE